MKRNVRKIAVILLAVMLFSALTMAAYADSVQRSFTKAVSFGSYVKIADHRSKDNATPMVFQINQNSIVNYYYARAISCDYYGNGEANVTMYNSQLVDHVSMYTGSTLYGIKNLAFERGTHAVISLKSNGPSTTATGYWAPDASGSYTIATP
jgi:hypothetical protein